MIVAWVVDPVAIVSRLMIVVLCSLQVLMIVLIWIRW